MVSASTTFTSAAGESLLDRAPRCRTGTQAPVPFDRRYRGPRFGQRQRQRPETGTRLPAPGHRARLRPGQRYAGRYSGRATKFCPRARSSARYPVVLEQPEYFGPLRAQTLHPGQSRWRLRDKIGIAPLFEAPSPTSARVPESRPPRPRQRSEPEDLCGRRPTRLFDQSAG